VQEAFWNDPDLQCGYCTPGMIMAGAALLADNPDPHADHLDRGLQALGGGALRR
jgi:carbon-monoxide dehydrogenase small subunit